MNIDVIRDAVARELQNRGIGDRAFYEEIREGRRDDSPFMVGAIAWANTDASAMEVAHGEG
jgi:hypothetical protein